MNGDPASDLQESSSLPPLAAAADRPKPIIAQASSIAASLLVPDDALVEVSDQLAPVANRSRPTTATRAHPRAPGRRRSSRGENSPCGGPSITRPPVAPHALLRQSAGRCCSQ